MRKVGLFFPLICLHEISFKKGDEARICSKTCKGNGHIRSEQTMLCGGACLEPESATILEEFTQVSQHPGNQLPHVPSYFMLHSIDY